MSIWNLFKINLAAYKKMLDCDYRFNASFRGGCIDYKFLHSIEWKYIKMYRKYQANIGSLWSRLYKLKLQKISKKTGINTDLNPNIGKGLIIGHWGTIVVNNEATFGEQVFITHNVTIGRDIRGKRSGVPSFGNRICIRTGSTVVGGITIGDDVLIAPNTFVNFDVPAHSIVIGNPASIHHRENATEGHLGCLEDPPQ